MSAYRDDDDFGRRYSGFEEGYTSADNRARRRREERPAGQESGRGRFIDTGDRYTMGYIPPERRSEPQPEPPRKAKEAPPQPGQQRRAPRDLPVRENERQEPQPPQQPRKAPRLDDFRAEDGSELPYDEIYEKGHSKSMLSELAAEQEAARQTKPEGEQPEQLSEAAEREPEEEPAARQRQFRRGDIFAGLAEEDVPNPLAERIKAAFRGVWKKITEWCEKLDGKTITWIFTGAIIIVAVILAFCIFLRPSCTSPEEIPVIEQGDGLDNNVTEPTTPEPPQEVISTSDGEIIIDEEIETDSFVVTVTGADGTYKRTNVYRAEEATMEITGQDETGFTFSLEASSEGSSGTVAGQAYFCAEQEAIFESSSGTLNFRFGSGGVTVYMTDEFPAFNGVSPDGIYVSGTPSYIEDAAAQSEEMGLDADIRKSEAVQTALDSLLSGQDKSLMESIFSNGTARVFENSEKGYDKNGTAINIDSQLGAVKYFSFIPGSGEELVMICSGDAKVYVGICDGMEYRYYTNDADYASEAPVAISGQAMGKGMTLSYQQ